MSRLAPLSSPLLVLHLPRCRCGLPLHHRHHRWGGLAVRVAGDVVLMGLGAGQCGSQCGIELGWHGLAWAGVDVAGDVCEGWMGGARWWCVDNNQQRLLLLIGYLANSVSG